jgi:hypothetical protein
VTVTTAPVSPAPDQARSAAARNAARAGPAEPAPPNTPRRTVNGSTPDNAARSAAPSVSATSPPLLLRLAPPAVPRPTTSPSSVATTQRVDVAPASTPTTRLRLIVR